jgi:hypothetical protein
MSEPIIAYKGFDENLCCRGLQYAIGDEYDEPKAKVCECGFHACEDPLDCLEYYAPNASRYCRVELSGEIHRKGEDGKVAATHIKILEELTVRELTEIAVQIRTAKAIEESKANGTYGEDYSNNGAATSSGDNGAATSSGYRGAATSSGDNGAATSSGDNGAATADNATAIAVAWGAEGRSKGVPGSHIVLAEWGDFDGTSRPLLFAKMFCVDGKSVKPDTWYALYKGELYELDGQYDDLPCDDDEDGGDKQES